MKTNQELIADLVGALSVPSSERWGLVYNIIRSMPGETFSSLSKDDRVKETLVDSLLRAESGLSPNLGWGMVNTTDWIVIEAVASAVCDVAVSSPEKRMDIARMLETRRNYGEMWAIERDIYRKGLRSIDSDQHIAHFLGMLKNRGSTA